MSERERRRLGCRDYELVELPRVSDPRGSLTFIEGGRHVPFEIARVYYLYDVPSSESRAGHAHYNLTQLIIAVAGSVTVNLDDGVDKASICLDRPDRGLLLQPKVWRTIDRFSDGSICLVLASVAYDEADYIRDYDTFLRLSRSGE